MTNYTWTKKSGDFSTQSNWSPSPPAGGPGAFVTANNASYVDGFSTSFTAAGSAAFSDTIALPGQTPAYKVTSNANRGIAGFTLGANATLGIATNSTFVVFSSGTNTLSTSSAILVDSGSTFYQEGGGISTSGRIYSSGRTNLNQVTIANGVATNETGVIASSGTNGLMLLSYDTITQSASSQIRGGTGGTGGTTDIVASTVTGGSVVARNSGAVVQLDGSTINNSLLDTTNGGLIQTYKSTGTGAPSNHLSTLNGIQNTGEVRVTDATQLALGGTINNRNYYAYSAIEVSSTGSETDLEVATSGATLTGNGRVTLSDSTGNYILGTTPGTQSTLTNLNNTISGAGNIGVGDGTLTMSNSGTILASGTNALNVNLSGSDSGGNLTIGDLNNAGGMVSATGSGGLHFVSTRVNGGNATIGSNSLMEFGSNESANLSFLNNNGTTGLLVLDTATKTSFAGIISNFSGSGTPTSSDGIDLRNIAFPGATLTAADAGGGNTLLEVKSATGRQVADLTLMGQYSASEFQLSADSVGSGTLVTTTHGGVLPA